MMGSLRVRFALDPVVIRSHSRDLSRMSSFVSQLVA